MPKIASRGEALRLFQQGWGVPRIAQELGVHEHSVRRSLQRAGVQLRKSAARPVSAANSPYENLDRQGCLKAVLPAIARFHCLAERLGALAAELLHLNPGDPAVQEFHLGAKQTKEFAGDCLFYYAAWLRCDPDRMHEPSADLAVIEQAINALAKIDGGGMSGTQ